MKDKLPNALRIDAPPATSEVDSEDPPVGGDAALLAAAILAHAMYTKNVTLSAIPRQAAALLAQLQKEMARVGG